MGVKNPTDYRIRCFLTRIKNDCQLKRERWQADLPTALPAEEQSLLVGITALTAIADCAQQYFDILDSPASAPRNPSPLPTSQTAEGALSSDGAPRRRTNSLETSP